MDRPSRSEVLIEQKHSEYLKNSRLYRRVYYTTRILTALSSALIPFVINNNQSIATILSIIIVVCVAIDAVFDPKSNWKLYSKATDLLAISHLKSQGEYQKYAEQLEILLNVEGKKLERLVELDDLQKKFEKSK